MLRKFPANCRVPDFHAILRGLVVRIIHIFMRQIITSDLLFSRKVVNFAENWCVPFAFKLKKYFYDNYDTVNDRLR